MQKSITKLLLLLIFISSNLIAQPSHSRLFETPELFHPVTGQNGAVATQEEQATNVGIKILQQGGNAIDAAVAIGYALAVTLPRAGNIGGGGFMNIWLHKEQKAYIIDYRETAPGKLDIKRILSVSPDEFTQSYLSSGIPGTVAGLNLAASKFGTLPLKKLVQPAINLAKHGFPVSNSLFDSVEFSKELLLNDKEATKIFFKNTKSKNKANKYIPYQIGENFKQPELARTLQLIANNGNKGFYNGDTANRIIKAMQANNGFITKTDLQNYQANLIDPIITEYKNYKIIVPPPPSAGIIIAELLNILEELNIDQIPYNSANYFHYLTESFNRAYIDRNYHLGDPAFVKNNTDKLISKKHAEHIAKQINLAKHTPSEDIDSHNKKWQEGNNTTHYVVIDKDLNVVSNTYTINTSFGNGKIIPGAGFFMNNELDDFTLSLGEPNAYGLIQGKHNLIAPGKRPLSSMAPIIILDENNIPVMSTGTPGGSRIITTVTQIILNNISNKLNISSAVAMPRIHSQLWPDILYYEQGISYDTIEKLKMMGHTVKEINAMGSAQSIQYNKPYFMATSDPRRVGAKATAY